MNNRAALAAVMPSLFAHEGVWRGTYRHLDAAGVMVDTHESLVQCEFPDDGPHSYIQHNRFTWADGRVQEATLPGILRDGRLWWDVATFHGSAWESLEGVILLRLYRKDIPNAEFREMITLAPDAQSRARTWHWFQDGRLIRRTLCDESRARD